VIFPARNGLAFPINIAVICGVPDLVLKGEFDTRQAATPNERRDKSKYSYLRSSDPEAKILYIWDYDFNSGNAEYKIREALGISSAPIVDFKLSECITKSPSIDEARKFFNTWHYAQFGKMPKFLHSIYLRDSLIACVKIGPVGRKEVAISSGFDSKNCFELDRFCIHPMFQKKNLGSFALGKSVREFFRVFPDAGAIVSFADSTFGHDGTIYKASNWTEVGKVKPDYVYIDPNGWVMHKKTLYNQAVSVHMTEAAYAESRGYRKIFGKEKTKFLIKRPDR
jgi:hypothetical protein